MSERDKPALRPLAQSYSHLRFFRINSFCATNVVAPGPCGVPTLS
jgi:hypothetical protein